MEPFSFIKFFSGFKAWYKVLFIAVIAAVCIGIYHKVFIKDTTHTDNVIPNAQAVYQVQQPKMGGFGCINYKVLEYSEKK